MNFSKNTNRINLRVLNKWKNWNSVLTNIQCWMNICSKKSDFFTMPTWQTKISWFVLTISMRENKNILKNFERQIRQNEQTIQKIFELKSKRDYDEFCFNKKNFEWKIFRKKIEKIVRKFVVFKKIWTQTKKIKNQKRQIDKIEQICF